MRLNKSQRTVVAPLLILITASFGLASNPIVDAKESVASPEMREWLYINDNYYAMPVQGDRADKFVSLTKPQKIDDCVSFGAPGAISGSVRSANNDRIGYISVSVFRNDIDVTGSSSYSGDDFVKDYTVSGLVPGEYRVRMEANLFSPAPVMHAMEWYTNSKLMSFATVINVLTGTTTSNIDFVLEPGAVITGQVREVGGTPLSGVTVEIFDAEGTKVGSAGTDSNGTYSTLAFPTGLYKARFSKDNYTTQYYNNSADLASATSISVASTSSVTSVNAILLLAPVAPTGVITGRVIDAATGLSASAYVGTSPPTGFNYFRTDANGVYTITTTPNQYKVYAGGGNYVTQFYNGSLNIQNAETVTVSASSVITNINFSLQTGGSIKGRYIDEGTGSPLVIFVNIYPYLFDATTNQPANLGGMTRDTLGNYVLRGIPSGSYKVQFRTANYEDEFYNDKPNIDSADAIIVTAPNTTVIDDVRIKRCTSFITPTPIVPTPTPTPTATSVPRRFVFLPVVRR